MATRAELNTAVTNLGNAIGTAAADIQAAFVRLEAKINANADFQPEIDAINAQLAALHNLSLTAQGKGN